MTTEEKLDRLTTIVDTLAGNAAAHDARIEALIEMDKALEKQWQAYLNTLPRN